jgi:hypothetical protein
MFGLITLLGLLLMIVVLLLMAGVIYFLARKLRATTAFAVGLALFGIVALLAAVNARDIYETHVYNHICRTVSGRHIDRIAKDVDGLRLVEHNDSGLDDWGVQGWSVFRKYGFTEWESAPLKWRHNAHAWEFCGVGASCNINSFVARYELRVRNAYESRHVITREKQIVDTETGQLLGSERTVYMERPSDLSMRNLFLMAWKFPQLMTGNIDQACFAVDEESFVSQVLVPRVGT